MTSKFRWHRVRKEQNCFSGNLEIKICTGKPSMTEVWIFSGITQLYPMFSSSSSRLGPMKV